MSAFVHLPVLSREAPEALVARPDGLYVDGTFGRGGHRLILERLAPQGRLIAFDRDPEAVAAAAAIKDPRFQIVHAPFSAMKERLGDLGIRQVDGIFLDIGVSSPQIDDPSRGFLPLRGAPRYAHGHELRRNRSGVACPSIGRGNCRSACGFR